MVTHCTNLHCKIITEDDIVWILQILCLCADLVSGRDELALALVTPAVIVDIKRQLNTDRSGTFTFLQSVLIKWISREGPNGITVKNFTSVLASCGFNKVASDIVDRVRDPESCPFKDRSCRCNNPTILTIETQNNVHGHAISLEEVPENRSPELTADPLPEVSTDPDRLASLGSTIIEIGTPLLLDSSSVPRQSRTYDVGLRAWVSQRIERKCMTQSRCLKGILVIIVVVVVYVSVNSQNDGIEIGSNNSSNISRRNSVIMTPSALIPGPRTTSVTFLDTTANISEEPETLVMADHYGVGSLDCKLVSTLEYTISSTDGEQSWFETCDGSSIQHLTLIGDFTNMQISHIFSMNLVSSVETLNFTGPHICKEFIQPQVCTNMYEFKNLREIIFWGNVSQCTELYLFLAKCATFGKSCDIILDRKPELRLGERDRNRLRDQCRGRVLIIKS